MSADTVVRLVRAAPLPTQPEPRVVGIDEWAWRRGRSYGTMVVDLERHTVLDLLPDRDAGSVAAWLRAHPGIEVIARDHADVFAERARAGAPQAQHVLDRFHLLRNLSVALRAIVAHHHGVIRAVGRARVDQEVEAPRAVAGAARLPTERRGRPGIFSRRRAAGPRRAGGPDRR